LRLESFGTILSYYGDLIHKIKSKTDAKIIFTSLLPRLVDFKLSERKLNKVNSELRRLILRYARTGHNREPGIAATGIFYFPSPY
jgi:hypothetical protein